MSDELIQRISNMMQTQDGLNSNIDPHWKTADWKLELMVRVMLSESLDCLDWHPFEEVESDLHGFRLGLRGVWALLLSDFIVKGYTAESFAGFFLDLNPYPSDIQAITDAVNSFMIQTTCTDRAMRFAELMSLAGLTFDDLEHPYQV